VHLEVELCVICLAFGLLVLVVEGIFQMLCRPFPFEFFFGLFPAAYAASFTDIPLSRSKESTVPPFRVGPMSPDQSSSAGEMTSFKLSLVPVPLGGLPYAPSPFAFRTVTPKLSPPFVYLGAKAAVNAISLALFWC